MLRCWQRAALKPRSCCSPLARKRTAIVAKVRGVKAYTDRLKRLSGPDAKREIGKALFVAGQAVQVEAQILISTGSVSGKGHVPSRPGEPPHNDTGVLANNIETVQIGPLHVEVSSNAPYAAALEYGTSRMAARPYMAPAAAKARDALPRGVAAAVNRAAGRARSADAARTASDQAQSYFDGVKGRPRGK